jgi:hypothetical protein
MALSKGDIDASSGLTKALYDAMDAELRPPLLEVLKEKHTTAEDTVIAVAKVQANWKQLSHTLASGLVAALHTEVPSAPLPNDSGTAETYSSAAIDPDFWKFFTNFVGVFQAWSKPGADVNALQTKLATLFADTTTPVPTGLKGVVR